MNIQEAKEQIRQSQAAIISLQNNAKGRDFNREEMALCAQLEGAIDALKMEIPEKPLTLQNGRQGSALRVPANGFRSLGEQCQSVAAAASPGAEIDQRLYQIRAASGLNESVPSEGGFLLQQNFSTDMLTSVFETGKLAKLCRRIPISGNSNSLVINGVDESSRVSGSRQGGILGYWLAEAALKTKSKPSFRQIKLELKKLIGLCYASDELLQDSAALDRIIRDAFVSEFGFMLDDAIVNGTGGGQPLGILTSGALVSVAAETGQKADTVVAENVIKMYSRLLPGSESTAYWLINKNVTPQLFQMSLAVGLAGVPLYQPANSMAGVPYQTLFGRPVIAIEQAATLGDLGDIILADFQNGYILAEKGGIQADVSIHVQFIYDESVFRFVMRVDGMPILAAPVTPYKGTASHTQSHFIALAAR